MNEDSFLLAMTAPLFFDAESVGIALDNFDPGDPHRRADEFDDKNTAPLGNQKLYDTSTSTPIKASNMSLTSFPDISDEIMSDYRIQKMLGHDVEVPNFVDLDTAPNYVGFIQNTVRSVVESENEFLSTDPRSFK